MSKFAWSFSAVNTFENCPMKWAYEKFYKKVPYRENEAAKKGNLVHKAMEVRCKEGRSLPKKYAGYEKYAKAIDFLNEQGAKVMCEKKMGLDKELKPVDFFAGDVYGRCAADILAVKDKHGVIIDWKTGKTPKADMDQLKLTARFALAFFPKIKVFTAQYAWLEHDLMLPSKGQEIIKTKEVMKWFEKDYMPRVERMEKIVRCEAFEHRPNPLCGWCEANNLGLCEHASRAYCGG